MNCGNCVNFKPLWEGSNRGTCLALMTMMYKHFSCSSPKNYKKGGLQLSLF